MLCVLLFVQIDTQSSELLILDPLILRRFLVEVELIAIQMEWEFLKQYNPINQDAKIRMLDTFESLKLKLYPVSCWPGCSVELDRKDMSQWGNEILIVNASAAAAAAAAANTK